MIFPTIAVTDRVGHTLLRHLIYKPINAYVTAVALTALQQPSV